MAETWQMVRDGFVILPRTPVRVIKLPLQA
jgi:hypothetical protein